jgi:hypothetical protein
VVDYTFNDHTMISVGFPDELGLPSVYSTISREDNGKKWWAYPYHAEPHWSTNKEDLLSGVVKHAQALLDDHRAGMPAPYGRAAKLISDAGIEFSWAP